MKKIFTILSLILSLYSFSQTNEFWGITTRGGASDNGGTIFSTKDDGTNLQTRFSFPIDNPGSGSTKGQLTAFNNLLYGITQFGGKFNLGVIFSFNPQTNIYTRLYNFEFVTGGSPTGTLTLYNGKFYGVASNGGSASTSSLGVIFEFDPVTLVYTKKITFTGTTGSALGGGGSNKMIEVAGKLYGISGFGLNNGGVLFEYDPMNNIYVVKKNFSNVDVNQKRIGNIVLYNNKFYGTGISSGSSSLGGIYEYDLATNVYALKYSMPNTAAGYYPAAGLQVYNNTLYGINQYGGANNRGNLFQFDPATNALSVLYSFTAASGANTESDLYLYNNIFYGFTPGGGANNFGTIFKFDPSTSILSKTYDFPGPVSQSPNNTFIDYNNLLYATTGGSGELNNGGGTILSYNAANDSYTKKLVLNTYSLLGSIPNVKLLYYNSKIYGSTLNGGANNAGVLFEFNPASNVYTKLLDFSVSTTGKGLGPLIEKNGIFYGNMESYQPSTGSNRGALFSYNPITNAYSISSFSGGIFGTPKGQLVDNNDGTLTGIFTYSAASTSSAGGIFKYTIATNTLVNFIQNVPIANGNFLQDIRFYNNNYYILAATTNNSNPGSILEYSIFGSLNTRATFSTTTNGDRPTGFLTPFNGKLYGLSSSGLNNNLNKQGTIVEYDPLLPYTLTKKYEFASATGQVPFCGFLLYNSKFYGLTSKGGSTGYDPVGVLYEFDPTTNVYSNKITFNYENGAEPNIAALIAAPSGSVLPIKLTNFTAKETASNSNLNWTTSFELNNKGYNIQHSTNGVSFTDIAFVNGKGNSTTNTNYNFTHYKPTVGKNYYRLQAVDFDGKTTLSNIEIVEIKSSKDFVRVYPNPTSEVINITSNKKISSLELFDITGRKIKSLQGLGTQSSIDVSMLTNGVYVLKVVLASGDVVEERIIVNK